MKIFCRKVAIQLNIRRTEIINWAYSCISTQWTIFIWFYFSIHSVQFTSCVWTVFKRFFQPTYCTVWVLFINQLKGWEGNPFQANFLSFYFQGVYMNTRSCNTNLANFYSRSSQMHLVWIFMLRLSQKKRLGKVDVWRKRRGLNYLLFRCTICKKKSPLSFFCLLMKPHSLVPRH